VDPVRRRAVRGQAALEFVLCAALLAGVLFVPWVEGDSVSTLLARRLADFVHGFFALIAIS
jgi:hypothetical protein